MGKVIKILGEPYEDLKTCLQDIKKGLRALKNYYTFLGLLLSVTALFLGIESEGANLRYVQALLLLLSSCSLIVLIFLSFKSFYKEKHSEMYYAFSLVFIWLSGLFSARLSMYLYEEFSAELYFYFRWLFIPVFAITVNIAFIYVFRALRKIHKDLDGRALEWFFLVMLNWQLYWAYMASDMQFDQIMRRLVEPTFSNLYLIYYFILTLLDEILIYPRIKRIKQGSLKKALTALWIIILIAPWLVRWLTKL